MIRKIFPFLLILLFVGPLLWLIFSPGFWVSDDGGWMAIRLAAFHDSLRMGQFPVRFLFSLNHGYGYPVLDFLYPLPFYIGELVHLTGFDFVDSVKILFGLSLLIGAFFMFLFARKWGTPSALFSAFVYTVAPYRLFDIFNRGSLGEAVAFVFPPIILFFLDRRNPVLAGLFTAALITSHNVIAFLFLPVILIYALIQWKSVLLTTYYLLLTLGLSAWFWFPAIYDLQFTRAATISVADFTHYFLGPNTYYLALPLGIIFILAILFHAVILRKSAEKDKTEEVTIIFFLVVTGLSLLFTLPASGVFWQNLPLPKLVQFPWRFLSLTTFSAALLAGWLIKKNKSTYSVFLALLIIFLTIIVPMANLKITRTFYPDSYYATNDDTTTVKNEYMPQWVIVDPQTRPDEPTAVYFPGIYVSMDRMIFEPNVDANGMVSHQGEIIFRETPWRLAADLISVISLIIAVFWLLSFKTWKKIA